MPPTPPQAAPHLARVDVLRACAILAVFCHHYWLAVRQLPGRAWDDGWWARVLVVPWELGFLGVNLFFVISGFCIHLSFLNWRQRRPIGAPVFPAFLGTFFWRRFWRIYPPYLVALLLFAWLHYGRIFDLQVLAHLGVHGLLANNLSAAFFHNINPSFWSIAVEWQLYLVYPLLLWVALAWRIEGAVALASLVAFAFRLGAPHFTTSFAVLHSPFAYWFEWAIGAWIAEYFVAGRCVFRAHAWLAAGLAAATVWAQTAPDFLTGRYFFPTLFFAVLVEWSVQGRGGLRAIERWLVPIGLCSYSLYLFHQPYLARSVAGAAEWIGAAPAWAVWVAIPAVLLLPLALLCWVAYRWIELPSIALGKRLWSRS